MENNEQSFSYTYSAQQRKEIEEIRKKYVNPQESKMDQLRKLHNSATRKAKIWSISLGVMGALILGTGMSLVMTELGDLLGILALPVGIGTGILGLVLVGLAYPVYNAVLKDQRRRIAPEILRITDELLQ